MIVGGRSLELKTEERKETEEEVQIEERFSNDVDRNLRELEALDWFGFGQVRKDK